MTVLTDGVHVVSNASRKELNEWAERCGIGRHWLHRGARIFHYDLPSKDRLPRPKIGGIYMGARIVTSRDLLRQAVK